ncbi:MAG: hypothetical protein WA785_13740 [Candidatus Acidiferrales bacterium]
MKIKHVREFLKDFTIVRIVLPAIKNAWEYEPLAMSETFASRTTIHWFRD